jgi:hypothetical protein
MQTHLTAGGSTVMASANLRMSLVSSSISHAPNDLKMRALNYSLREER